MVTKDLNVPERTDLHYYVVAVLIHFSTINGVFVRVGISTEFDLFATRCLRGRDTLEHHYGLDGFG